MSKQTNKTVKGLISNKELSAKKNILEEAKIVLKREFVGIDNIIDEVIHSIESWFIYPEGQIRPTIVNLWGMTGVGKTSLVTRLSELLKVDERLYRFDIGDYSSGEMRLKRDFSEKLKNSEKKPIVILFDEFQLGRTIAENGTEVDRNGLRALWDLIDTGTISIINENYYSNKVISLYLKLQHCIEQGVEATNGKITRNKKLHNDLFYDSVKEKNKKSHKLQDENGDNVDSTLLVPAEYYYYLKNLSTNHFLDTEASFSTKFLQMNHVEIVDFLKEILDKNLKPVLHDFSQSIIFIAGNLDEVYHMSGVIDPDYDADMFYSNSLKITIPKVKEALKKRFRVEQIARLGNNHILYPAFSSTSFKALIQMELDKFKTRVLNRYGIEIELDNSINDIIYKEGVFPTQGTRPIFTTINTLVESYISKIVSDIILENITVTKINWKYIDETGEYEVHIHGNDKPYVKKYSLNLKLDNLRKSSKDDNQAHTAVHEAGHAVISAIHLALIPEEIVSKTAGGLSDGYCRIKMPNILTKNIIKKDIAVGLGGYVAEIAVFGDELLSTGSHNDIEKVTEKAISYVKSFGMANNIPIQIGMDAIQLFETHYPDHQEADKEVKKLIQNALKIAQKIINENRVLLLKVSEYLSENSRMNGDLFLKYVKKYGVNIPTFKKSDTYSGFKSILTNKIKNTKIKK